MKKIFQKMLTLGIISSIVIASSCAPIKKANTNYDKTQYLKSIVSNEKIQNDEKWDLFLSRPYIQAILKASFDSEDKKNKYIQSQKEISSDYLKELKAWVRYANNIDATFDKGEGKRENKRTNIVTSIGSRFLDDLYNKNWLFFLYNLDKFIFIQFPNVTTDLNERNDYVDQVEVNKKVYNNFYNPESNEIIDYVIQKYDYKKADDSDSKYIYENRIFLLTKDGRIFHFDINGIETKSNDKIINNELSKINPPRLHSWVYSYPKLIASKDKLSEFDLKKYVEIISEWEDETYKKATAGKKAIFSDYYGKIELRYTLINVKD
ncbi:aromatic motif membrane protein [Mycoplasmopsis cynos]|uniref:aromatic motif membrane protein n=1 Tax=Mycoplasmopsis cynos TaxID=171284 RepID=UPI0024C7416C|nr:aromatic motif membrane protein [Mycoplasmopsis cynos]WAM09028.1 hypothetical protein ONA03_01465 [Mycoplasmopsis cynos]